MKVSSSLLLVAFVAILTEIVATGGEGRMDFGFGILLLVSSTWSSVFFPGVELPLDTRISGGFDCVMRSERAWNSETTTF